jgi:hypothetical protein
MNSEFTRLKNIILADPARVEVLEFARDLNLPDWAIGAGFVRNAVWDHLHGYEFATPLNDIDVLISIPGTQIPKPSVKLNMRLMKDAPNTPGRCATRPACICAMEIRHTAVQSTRLLIGWKPPQVLACGLMPRVNSVFLRRTGCGICLLCAWHPHLAV